MAVGDTGGRLIAQSLGVNSSLTRINLSRNGFSHTTIADFARFLSLNRVLKELILDENDLGVSGGAALCNLLKNNRTLETLHINSCNLCSLGTKVCAGTRQT